MRRVDANCEPIGRIPLDTDSRIWTITEMNIAPRQSNENLKRPVVGVASAFLTGCGLVVGSGPFRVLVAAELRTE